MTEPISRRAALASSAMFLVGCRSSALLAGAPRATAVEGPDDLAQLMEIAGVPGISVARVEGTRVTAVGHGVTRAGDGSAVNGDTIFEAASLSKPVFASVVMQLVEDRLLDLDRPLREYVPLPATDARSQSITARHVLSHSTGWRNWRNNAQQTLVADFEPGSRFGYSGEGYYFLGRVAEKVSGAGIMRLTQERVLGPLGMRRSSYMWRPELDANRAEPHTNRGAVGSSFGVPMAKGLRKAAESAGVALTDWKHEDAERFLPKEEFPVLPNFLLPNVAGSLLTTANDYGRFLAHLMERRELVDRMMTRTTPINSALAWGLGAGVQTQGGAAQLWHWGDNFGFKNFMMAAPRARSAIVVFTNGQNGRAIYERVIRAERGDQSAFVWI